MDLEGIMGKKKRHKLFSVFAVIEGEKREVNLLLYLKEIYLDKQKVKFMEHPVHGGNPDVLLGHAIRYLHFAYDRIFVWIDEDKDLNQESREALFKNWKIDNSKKNDFLRCPLGDLQKTYNSKKQNPILIVSQPVCVESLILRTLGKTPCHQSLQKNILSKQKRELKNSIDGMFAGECEYQYYLQNLSKDKLEEKRTEIKELDLLISMLIKN